MKPYIIILVVIIILCIVVILNRDSQISSLQKEKKEYELKIENSRLRQENLLQEMKILKSNFEILVKNNDNLTLQIDNKETERIEIIKYVDSQIKNINDISIDSTLIFLSNRLSQANIN